MIQKDGFFAGLPSTRKSGDSSLPDELENINIAVFGNHMERLCNYLDGVDSYLDHIREVRNEMEAEYRNEMAAEYHSEMYAAYETGW